MSIPVLVTAHRVFADRVDLTIREEAGGLVRVSLRLSRAAAWTLAGVLNTAAAITGDGLGDVAAVLEPPIADHPIADHPIAPAPEAAP